MLARSLREEEEEKKREDNNNKRRPQAGGCFLLLLPGWRFNAKEAAVCNFYFSIFVSRENMRGSHVDIWPFGLMETGMSGRGRLCL